jgi:hypothetical protein
MGTLQGSRDIADAAMGIAYASNLDEGNRSPRPLSNKPNKNPTRFLRRCKQLKIGRSVVSAKLLSQAGVNPFRMKHALLDQQLARKLCCKGGHLK